MISIFKKLNKYNNKLKLKYEFAKKNKRFFN